MEYEEKEMYLFLNFQGALPPSTLRRKHLFFKLVNIDKENPLVQLDESLYKGSYTDCIGTNVFFEEAEIHDEDSVQRPTPINLKYLLKQTKVLELERIKLPEDFIRIDDNAYVKLKFNEDYRHILEKIVTGTFRIDNYIVEKNPDSDSEEQEPIETENIIKLENKKEQVETNEYIRKKEHKKIEKEKPLPTSDNLHGNSCFENEHLIPEEPQRTTQEPIIESTKDINGDDEFLNMLVKQPLKLEQKQEQLLLIEDIVPEEKLSYYLMRDLILQDISYDKIQLNIIEDDLNNFVDIDSSVKQGIIQFSTETPRKFTDIEINSLLSLRNFENLRIMTKLYILIKYLKTEHQNLKEMTKEDLMQVDSFGHTPLQRHELLKSFANDIVHQIAKKIKERQSELNDLDGNHE